MKLVIPPVHDQHREHDVTRRLVSAIAEELWRLYGGNDHFNWVEAERHLQRIVGQARAEARETEEDPSAAAAIHPTPPVEWLGQPDHEERSAPDRANFRKARNARRQRGAGSSLAAAVGATREKSVP